MKTKICTKCGKKLLLSEFYNDKNAKDGKYPSCKKCRKEYLKNNKEKCKKYQKKYKENNKEKIKKYNKNNYKRIWARQTLNDHKYKGNIINLSIDYVHNLAENTLVCPICGCLLDWEHGTKLNNNTPSLDRKYNNNVLNEDNIWIICYKCNRMKSDNTFIEFIDYCKMIVNKFG